jgi:hypothetical protein
LIAKKLGKTPVTLRIYDPYYCNGGIIERLNSLGFTNVYNKCEDFYKIKEEGKIPDHDVVITNPPYSEDHKQKCFQFCAENKKPWFVLVPYFTYQNTFFKTLSTANK